MHIIEHIRFFALFQQIETVSRVDLQAYSKDTVVALLRYLYINDTLPNQRVVEELERLASR